MLEQPKKTIYSRCRKWLHAKWAIPTAPTALTARFPITYVASNQSLIPSSYEIAAIESVDKWAGEDWIADLCQSKDEVKITDKNWDEPVESEDLDVANVPHLSELVMLLDDNCLLMLKLAAVVVSNSESNKFNMPDVEWEEIAMQIEDILQAISALDISGLESKNLSGDSESTPSTPPLCLVIQLASFMDSPLTTPLPSTQLQAVQPLMHVNIESIANKCVTAMQTLLAIEDKLIQSIHYAMSLYNNHSHFEHHLKQVAILSNAPTIPHPSGPSPIQEEPVSCGARARCPPQWYIQEEDDSDEAAQPVQPTRPAQGPQHANYSRPNVMQPTFGPVGARPTTPQCLPNLPPLGGGPQQFEFIDIDAGLDQDLDDDDDDPEPQIPQARAPCSTPQDTLCTTNSINDSTDPLELAQSSARALDIHYFFFFEKCAKESSTCLLCRDSKNQDPKNFLPDHKFVYSANMGNSGLHLHVEKFHILEYLEQAKK
ncbi:hypothetical protein L210DRAFT_3647686 [Boletus edulis BED1]|uniref:Uncharacterized protein n=1 Tax=Boletus edulis BED1 TaxID=1328754 RepID=A0AAD4BPV4_BOLED|nr:hypothetical protein L210DRAFT_3647686 [Boletus edulis BED1]